MVDAGHRFQSAVWLEVMPKQVSREGAKDAKEE